MPTRIYKKEVFILAVMLLMAAALPVAAEAVNINTASSEDLQTLPGIGPTYAQRIIDYRSANGPFETKEEIKNVKGIGDATYAKLESSITVGETGSSLEGGGDQKAGAVPSITAAKPIPRSSLSVEAYGPEEVLVGSPAEFEAESNVDAFRVDFHWSFGDGAEAFGERVVHTYEYPGDYAVVLSASYRQDEASARLDTEAVSAELSVTYSSPERIEIKNGSESEANLYGRALYDGDRLFVFPQGTIVKAGQSISFSSNVTGLASANASDTSIIIVGEEPDKDLLLESLGENKLEKISLIKEEIAALEGEIAKRSQAAAPAVREIATGTPLFLASTSAYSKDTGDSEDARSWFDIVKEFFLRK